LPPGFQRISRPGPTFPIFPFPSLLILLSWPVHLFLRLPPEPALFLRPSLALVIWILPSWYPFRILQLGAPNPGGTLGSSPGLFFSVLPGGELARRRFLDLATISSFLFSTFWTGPRCSFHFAVIHSLPVLPLPRKKSLPTFLPAAFKTPSSTPSTLEDKISLWFFPRPSFYLKTFSQSAASHFFFASPAFLSSRPSIVSRRFPFDSPHFFPLPLSQTTLIRISVLTGFHCVASLFLFKFF